MATNQEEGTSAPKKQLLLNAFVMTTPSHLSPGQWNQPGNKTADYNKLSFWTDLARLLDSAGFHAMFIADVLGPYDVYKGPANVGPVLASGAQFPVNDPLYSVPAMAAVTKNLIFGVTASTTYDAPYALARRFSTVDHLAEGRVGWNIVTSYLESAARNFGLETQIEHDERYRIADEYMDVVYKVSRVLSCSQRCKVEGRAGYCCVSEEADLAIISCGRGAGATTRRCETIKRASSPSPEGCGRSTTRASTSRSRAHTSASHRRRGRPSSSRLARLRPASSSVLSTPKRSSRAACYRSW